MWHAAADRQSAPDRPGARRRAGRPRLRDPNAGVQGPEPAFSVGRRRASDTSRAGPAADLPAEPRDPEAEAAAADAARKKRTLRIGAISAMAFLGHALPMDAAAQPPAAGRFRPARAHPRRRPQRLPGRAHAGDRADRRTAGRKRFPSGPRDEILINDEKQLLRDVEPGDHVAIEVYRDASGFKITGSLPREPKLQPGRIEAVDADEGKLILATDDADDERSSVRVPGSVEIVFNGRAAPDGKPGHSRSVGARRPRRGPPPRPRDGPNGDRAERAPRGRARRHRPRRRPRQGQKLTVARGSGDDAQLVVLPFAPKCEITINQSQRAGRSAPQAGRSHARRYGQGLPRYPRGSRRRPPHPRPAGHRPRHPRVARNPPGAPRRRRQADQLPTWGPTARSRSPASRWG